MTPEEITAGTAHLSMIDSALAAIILRVGPCALVPDTDPFKALARAIIGQQVSIHAAAAIWGRFESLCGPGSGVTPASVTTVAVEELRSAGLSGAKARYVHDLSAKFLDGTIEFGRLDSMTDEEIIIHLTQVKGVGRWTAEMFLIFSLGRSDILPVDDLGLLAAVHRAYETDQRPAPSVVGEMGEQWRPWRSLATWYLWQSLKLAPLNSGS